MHPFLSSWFTRARVLHISVLGFLILSVCSPVIDFLLASLAVVSRARLSLIQFLAPLFSGLLGV
jgi:hypothetical protein